MKETTQKPVRLDLYDPKRDTIHYIPEGFDVYEHDTATQAIEAGFESGENGVIILEELLTIEKSEYKTLKKYAAIRRRGIDSLGPGIYATTQRPVNMPTDLIAIPDHLLCGQMVRPSDVAAVADIAGDEIGLRLPKLPPRHFILHRI